MARLVQVTTRDRIFDVLEEGIELFCDVCSKEQCDGKDVKGWKWLYEEPLFEDDDSALFLCPRCAIETK